MRLSTVFDRAERLVSYRPPRSTTSCARCVLRSATDQPSPSACCSSSLVGINEPARCRDGATRQAKGFGTEAAPHASIVPYCLLLVNRSPPRCARSPRFRRRRSCAVRSCVVSRTLCVAEPSPLIFSIALRRVGSSRATPSTLPRASSRREACHRMFVFPRTTSASASEDGQYSLVRVRVAPVARASGLLLDAISQHTDPASAAGKGLVLSFATNPW